MADPKKRPRAWRPLLRALHRDFGYVAVGLTLVYALSGIAVNHIADWDPSFRNYERTVELARALPGDDDAVAAEVLAKLGIEDRPTELYRAGDDQLEILFDKRTVHVNTATGQVVDEGQSPRFLLRVANWLHLNRGKKAWTYVADAYAGALVFLALSGLFMLPGKRGLAGRGGVLVALGMAVPFLYVQISGGPDAPKKRGPAPEPPRAAAELP